MMTILEDYKAKKLQVFYKMVPDDNQKPYFNIIIIIALINNIIITYYMNKYSNSKHSIRYRRLSDTEM